MLIYQEYVERKQLLTFIPTYYLSQDPLEILFGKIRAMNGYNDNPTVEQFTGAFRKLLANDALLCSSASNCAEVATAPLPFDNILHVSSAPSNSAGEADEGISPDELDALYSKILEIESIEDSGLLDSQKDYGIAFVSNDIEQRILRSNVYCVPCSSVFSENEKLTNFFGSTNVNVKPCRSTFLICKEMDRLMKIEILQSVPNFNTIYNGISNILDIKNCFTNTDFTHNPAHKTFLIRSIAETYIHVKGVHVMADKVMPDRSCRWT